MNLMFDKSRARYPELWEGCMRAYNHAYVHSYTAKTAGQSGTYGTLQDFSDYRINASIQRLNTSNTGYDTVPSIWLGVRSTNHNGYGAANNTINFSDAGLPTGGGPISVSWRMFCNTYEENEGASVIFALGDSRTGASSSTFQVYADGTGLRFGTYAFAGATIPWVQFENKWHYFTYTSSGSTINAYLDGKLYATSSLTPNVSLWGTAYIGGLNLLGGVYYPLIAFMSEFAIHKRVLSDQEIQLLASEPQIMYQQRSRRRTASAPTGNRRRRIILPQWYI